MLPLSTGWRPASLDPMRRNMKWRKPENPLPRLFSLLAQGMNFWNATMCLPKIFKWETCKFHLVRLMVPWKLNPIPLTESRAWCWPMENPLFPPRILLKMVGTNTSNEQPKTEEQDPGFCSNVHVGQCRWSENSTCTQLKILWSINYIPSPGDIPALVAEPLPPEALHGVNASPGHEVAIASEGFEG